MNKYFPDSLPHKSAGSHEADPRFARSNALFRIGDKGLTQETRENGQRILHWVASEVDNQFADIAGWGKLNHKVDSDGLGSVEIPDGTRTAGSVLGGMEAWQGEKADVLNFVSKYQTKVYKRFKGIDTSVTLDTVAVTKATCEEDERCMFIAPPHAVSGDVAEIQQWYGAFVQDLEIVLADEPQRDTLINGYVSNLREIYS